MDMRQLEAFVYVAENYSFSKAGELLHLTQPTISSHIASLENELKCKLIIRNSKETFPSEAGQLLYDYAKQILTLRRQAEEAIREFSGQMHGSLAVAASTVPGQYFLPKLVQCFREKYPEIRFDIQMADSTEVADMVISRRVEVGFTGTLSESNKCICREFADDELVVITPNEPRFSSCQQTGFPVQQLLQEPFISRETGSGTRLETERFLAELGIEPEKLNIVVEVRLTEMVMKMVSEKMGIAIVSKSACEEYCQAGKLLAFPFSTRNLHRKLYMVKRKNNILSPAAQAFYDFVKEYYKK